MANFLGFGGGVERDFGELVNLFFLGFMVDF